MESDRLLPLQSLELITDLPCRLLAILFLCWSASYSAVWYLYVRLDDGSVNIDHEVWRRVGETILGGVAPYVQPAVDNKPPLVQIYSAVAVASGQYLVAWLALVTLAVAVVAYSLYRFGEAHGEADVGLVAGILFLSALPGLQLLGANPRVVAVAGMTVALAARQRACSGVALGFGALWSQYAVVAVPGVVWYRHRVLNESLQDVLRWFGVVMLTVVFGYACIGLLWGWESLAGAVYWSILLTPLYVVGAESSALTQTSARYSLFEAPLFSLGMLTYFIVFRSLFISVPALISISKLWDDDYLWLGPVCALVMIGLLPFVVRAFTYYALFALPAACLLAAVGYKHIYTVSEVPTAHDL